MHRDLQELRADRRGMVGAAKATGGQQSQRDGDASIRCPNSLETQDDLNALVQLSVLKRRGDFARPRNEERRS